MAVITNHQAGAFSIQYFIENSLVDLGYTRDGFIWEITHADINRIREDRYGATPVNALTRSIEAMRIRGTFTWYNPSVWKAAHPFIPYSGAALSAYAAPGSQINPGYGFGTGSGIAGNPTLASQLVLTRLTGIVDDNSLRILNFEKAWPVGGLSYLLSAAEIVESPITFEIFPTVGSAVPTGANTTEPVWFTPTYGA